MRRAIHLAFSCMLLVVPLEGSRAQGAITSDPALERRVLADTALVHELPAQHSDKPLIAGLLVTRADRMAMEAHLDQLRALLHGDSAVMHGRGVSLVFSNEISVDTVGSRRLVTGLAEMTSWPYGVLDGRLEYYSAKSVQLWVNQDLCSADEKVYGVGFRLAPKFDGRFHGFPMLDSVVVITHRIEPPCLPVSRERVLVALRRQLDRVLGQVAAGSEAHERAQALDAMLASMSPAELGTDAYLSRHECDVVVCFVSPDAGDAEQLVVPNPDFYDRSRPTAVQAVTLALPQLFAPSNPPNEVHDRFIRRVLDTFDWSALNALVQ